MKKKLLLCIVIICVITITNVHALGIGVQGNFYAGEIFAPGISLVVSPTSITHIALNWYLDFDKTNIIGLTFDAVPLNIKILPSPKFEFMASREDLSLYFNLGLGLFANIAFVDKELSYFGGVRIPVGFSFYLAKLFEIFTYVSPSFEVNLIPAIEFGDRFYPVAIGVRLWFK